MTQKIESFTSAVANKLAEEIEQSLQGIAEKYGIQIKRGRGTFGSGHFSMKLDIATVGEGGQAKTREYDDLVKMLPMLNLNMTESDLSGPFKNPSLAEPFKIIGYRTRAPKKPFMIETESGKVLVTNRSFIEHATKQAA